MKICQVCKWADVSRINAQKRKSLLLHHRLHSYFSRFHNHISNCLHLFIIECFHCSIGFDSLWLEEELMKVAPYSQLGKIKIFSFSEHSLMHLLYILQPDVGS